MSSLPYSIFVLRCMGVWYSDDELTGWKSKIYICYSAFIIITVYSFTLSHFIMLYECTSDPNDISDALFMLLTLITMCGKMFNVIVKRKVIAKLIKDLQTDPFYPHDKSEFAIDRQTNHETKIYTLMYGIMADLTSTMLTVVSVTQDIPRRKLPYKAWLPFNATATPIGYWSVYIQQTIGLYISTNMNVGFDTLMVGMMIMTCTQLKIFKYRFEKMCQTLKYTDNASEDTIFVHQRECLEKKLFSDCVRHHVAIYQFAEVSNDTFAVSVFLQYCNSSLVLCVSTYCLSQMEPFTQEFFSLVMYLMCVLIQIFIFCRYATEVELESQKICNAIYSTDWTSLTVNTQKKLVIIMARISHPIQYKTGHITLSLDSFCNLLKLNYSVYNVLQRSFD